MKSITIFIKGIGQYNFIAPILNVLSNRNNANYQFFTNKKGNFFDNNYFPEDNLNVVDKRISFYDKFKSLIRSFKVIYLKYLVLSLLIGGLKSFRKSLTAILYDIANFCVKSDCNIYHVHFVTAQDVLFFPLLNSNQKLVLSFWGSDLFRQNNFIYNYLIGLALQRADSITCQSVTMKEFILVKFNRNLEDKIKVVQFILDNKIFKAIDNIQNEGKLVNNSFIKEGSINVLIGHNANPENRHREIIQTLKKLPETFKKNLNLIFVFGYGINKKDFKDYYLNLLTEELDRGNLKFQFVKELLSPVEIASLRAFSQICIHVPSTDALSAAITESMYASSLVICGSWLPYDPFRSAGVTYSEVDNISDINGVIIDYLNNTSSYKSKLKDNKVKIKNKFLSNHIGEKWQNIFEELE